MRSGFPITAAPIVRARKLDGGMVFALFTASSNITFGNAPTKIFFRWWFSGYY